MDPAAGRCNNREVAGARAPEPDSANHCQLTFARDAFMLFKRAFDTISGLPVLVRLVPDNLILSACRRSHPFVMSESNRLVNSELIVEHNFLSSARSVRDSRMGGDLCVYLKSSIEHSPSYAERGCFPGAVLRPYLPGTISIARQNQVQLLRRDGHDLRGSVSANVDHCCNSSPSRE